MALVCPQCKQIFEKSGVCPLCNVVLLFHAEGLQNTPVQPTHGDDEPPRWQQTPWGKIVIGLILAQGIRFGCEQVLTAGFLATGDGSDVWETLWGIVLRHSIHGCSLILGGALAGAGQTRGMIYGALIGLVSGIVAVALKRRELGDFTSLLFYAEPIMHLAMGAVGGGLGMLIWRPTPTLPELDGNTPAPMPISNLGLSLGNLFTGPVHIGRVCAGAFVIVVGVVWSKAILEFLLRASNGTLTISSQLQAQLVSMEITALVALIGASFAGASTRNGLKQGLCVGICASMIVLGIQIGGPRFHLESAILTLSGIVVVALIGGWFGGQLFPPLLQTRRRRFWTY